MTLASHRFFTTTLALLLFAASFVSSLRAETPESLDPNWIIPPPLKDLDRDYKVRIVYHVPSDREVKPKYREKLEVLMRVVADIYQRDFTSKGIKTRGLDFEFEEDGHLQVHLVKGKHPAKHYTGDPPTNDRLFNSTTADMIAQVGYPMRRACIIFSEAGGIAEATPAYPYCGIAMVSADMLRDEITGSTVEQQIAYLFDEKPVTKVDGTEAEPRNRASQISNGVLLHELGHVFYMLHDQRDRHSIMVYGYHNLRLMYDKREADSHPVRFSEEHARIAATTRFLSEEFNDLDGTEPKVEFSLRKPPQAGDTEIEYLLKASDDEGLGCFILYESTLESLLGGEALEGKTIEKEGTLKRPIPVRSGQLLHYRIYLMDKNGNAGMAELGYRVPLEKQESETASENASTAKSPAEDAKSSEE